MISKGLFAQVAMIALAVGITFTYIKPTFTDITNTQNDIATYQIERQKISAVNSQLAGLVSKLNTVSPTDQRKLLTYIPDDVDTVAVPRVIQVMANQSGVILKQVNYLSIVEKKSQDQNLTDPVAHSFAFSVEGSYSQIKNLISLLEKNEYPLEIHTLDISVLEGGFLSAQFGVITYAHSYPENET